MCIRDRHTVNSSYLSTYEYYEKKDGPDFLKKPYAERPLKEKYLYIKSHIENLNEKLEKIKGLWCTIKDMVRSQKNKND